MRFLKSDAMVILRLFPPGKKVIEVGSGSNDFAKVLIMLIQRIKIMNLCGCNKIHQLKEENRDSVFITFQIYWLNYARTGNLYKTLVWESIGKTKNQLVPEDISFYKLVVTDVTILLLAGLSEYFLFGSKERTKIIVYNNLEMIRPEKRDELFAELKSKFGIANIKTLKIGKIDVPKSTVRLQVTFRDTENNSFDDE
ncbi:MAG: DUF4956 domain-containing protein [Cyclobacteriaceae bacterium]|nr:DUF4956 domain-containing protein [Cyclobacteriaceae bacterium]